MKTRNKILWLFGFLILSSCKGNIENLDIESKATTLLRKAQESLIINDKDIPPTFEDFLSKYQDFSLKVNDHFFLQNDETNNNAISPLSLFMALAMLSECTANNSQQEILNALNMSLEEIQENISILYGLENKTLSSYHTNKEDEMSSIKETHNSLWFNKGLDLNSNTLDSLANNYYVDSYESDFYSNNKQANENFTNYVKEKTHGLINKDFHISPETILMLVNTFYLKDIWGDTISRLSLTNDKYDFLNRDGSVTTKKLMNGLYVDGRVLENEDYKTFFTKTFSGLRLHFMLPKNCQLENVWNKENIQTMLDLNNYEYVNEEIKTKYLTSIIFPSFEASSEIDLKEILTKNLEVKEIFDSSKADFSPLSSHKLYTETASQNTKLKVNDEGIEGAAVTFFTNKATSVAPEYQMVYEKMIVDRAFGYVLTDSHGVILFSGTINQI